MDLKRVNSFCQTACKQFEKCLHFGDMGISQGGRQKLFSVVKGKVIVVQTVEVRRVADIRLTDGGKVVSPTRRPLFTPRKIPGTHFC
jgi:hypothetical protein